MQRTLAFSLVFNLDPGRHIKLFLIKMARMSSVGAISHRAVDFFRFHLKFSQFSDSFVLCSLFPA